MNKLGNGGRFSRHTLRSNNLAAQTLQASSIYADKSIEAGKEVKVDKVSFDDQFTAGQALALSNMPIELDGSVVGIGNEGSAKSCKVYGNITVNAGGKDEYQRSLEVVLSATDTFPPQLKVNNALVGIPGITPSTTLSPELKIEDTSKVVIQSALTDVQGSLNVTDSVTDSGTTHNVASELTNLNSKTGPITYDTTLERVVITAAEVQFGPPTGMNLDDYSFTVGGKEVFPGEIYKLTHIDYQVGEFDENGNVITEEKTTIANHVELTGTLEVAGTASFANVKLSPASSNDVGFTWDSASNMNKITSLKIDNAEIDGGYLTVMGHPNTYWATSPEIDVGYHLTNIRYHETGSPSYREYTKVYGELDTGGDLTVGSYLYVDNDSYKMNADMFVSFGKPIKCIDVSTDRGCELTLDGLLLWDDGGGNTHKKLQYKEGLLKWNNKELLDEDNFVGIVNNTTIGWVTFDTKGIQVNLGTGKTPGIQFSRTSPSQINKILEMDTDGDLTFGAVKVMGGGVAGITSSANDPIIAMSKGLQIGTSVTQQNLIVYGTTELHQSLTIGTGQDIKDIGQTLTQITYDNTNTVVSGNIKVDGVILKDGAVERTLTVNSSGELQLNGSAVGGGGGGSVDGITSETNKIVIHKNLEVQSQSVTWVTLSKATQSTTTGSSATLLDPFGTEFSVAGEQSNPNLIDGGKFGSGIGISETGEYMIIGAPLAGGNSTLYENEVGSNVWKGRGKMGLYKRGETGWELKHTVLSTDVGGGTYIDFGKEVAISESGQWVAVAAPKADNNLGRVHLFERTGDTLTWKTSIQGTQTDDELGGQKIGSHSRLVLRECGGEYGDVLTLLVGSKDNTDEDNKSEVSIYTYNSGSNEFSNLLNVKPSDVNDQQLSPNSYTLDFRHCVTMSKDTLKFAVADPRYGDSNLRGWGGDGVVYVFFRASQTGTDFTYQRIVSEGINNSAWNSTEAPSFGGALHMSADGNWLAVAEKGADGADHRGRVETYQFNSSNNQFAHYATIDGSGLYQEFGFAVSLNSDGNRLAVLSLNNDSQTTQSWNQYGALYVYKRTAASWELHYSVVNPDNTVFNRPRMMMMSETGPDHYIAVVSNFEKVVPYKYASGQQETTSTHYGQITLNDSDVNTGWMGNVFCQMTNAYFEDLAHGNGTPHTGDIPTDLIDWTTITTWVTDTSTSALNPYANFFTLGANFVSVKVTGYYRVTCNVTGTSQSAGSDYGFCMRFAKSGAPVGPVASAFIRESISSNFRPGSGTANLVHVLYLNPNENVSVQTANLTESNHPIRAFAGYSQLLIERL